MDANRPGRPSAEAKHQEQHMPQRSRLSGAYKQPAPTGGSAKEALELRNNLARQTSSDEFEGVGGGGGDLSRWPCRAQSATGTPAPRYYDRAERPFEVAKYATKAIDRTETSRPIGGSSETAACGEANWLFVDGDPSRQALLPLGVSAASGAPSSMREAPLAQVVPLHGLEDTDASTSRASINNNNYNNTKLKILEHFGRRNSSGSLVYATAGYVNQIGAINEHQTVSSADTNKQAQQNKHQHQLQLQQLPLNEQHRRRASAEQSGATSATGRHNNLSLLESLDTARERRQIIDSLNRLRDQQSELANWSSDANNSKTFSADKCRGRTARRATAIDIVALAPEQSARKAAIFSKQNNDNRTEWPAINLDLTVRSKRATSISCVDEVGPTRPQLSSPCPSGSASRSTSISVSASPSPSQLVHLDELRGERKFNEQIRNHSPIEKLTPFVVNEPNKNNDINNKSQASFNCATNKCDRKLRLRELSGAGNSSWAAGDSRLGRRRFTLAAALRIEPDQEVDEEEGEACEDEPSVSISISNLNLNSTCSKLATRSNFQEPVNTSWLSLREENLAHHQAKLARNVPSEDSKRTSLTSLKLSTKRDHHNNNDQQQQHQHQHQRRVSFGTVEAKRIVSTQQVTRQLIRLAGPKSVDAECELKSGDSGTRSAVGSSRKPLERVRHSIGGEYSTTLTATVTAIITTTTTTTTTATATQVQGQRDKGSRQMANRQAASERQPAPEEPQTPTTSAPSPTTTTSTTTTIATTTATAALVSPQIMAVTGRVGVASSDDQSTVAIDANSQSMDTNTKIKRDYSNNTSKNVTPTSSDSKPRLHEKEDSNVESIMANAKLRQEEFARLLDEHEQIVNEIHMFENRISDKRQVKLPESNR